MSGTVYSSHFETADMKICWIFGFVSLRTITRFMIFCTFNEFNLSALGVEYEIVIQHDLSRPFTQWLIPCYLFRFRSDGVSIPTSGFAKQTIAYRNGILSLEFRNSYFSSDSDHYLNCLFHYRFSTRSKCFYFALIRAFLVSGRARQTRCSLERMFF